MTSTSSVPPITFTPTGLDVPTQSAVLAGFQADMNAAFGNNLNFGTPTQPGGAPPQVQHAGTCAAIISNSYDVFAQFVDQIDPDNATGFMQDAIARIYFLNRNPAVPTAVQLVCTGALGTPIPVGTQAKDTSGNIYVCTQAGNIPVSGNITLSFANIVTGPIPCPANTVNIPYTTIPGWESVNNPSAGVVGSNVETAAEFEFRRQNSVAANGNGSLPAIYGTVFKVPNVIDLYATQNVLDTPIIVGSTNYTLAGHSLYVAVVGGTAANIAQAIWTKKNEGSNMNGNTTVVVTDTSGYSFPQPTYNITFNVPTATPVNFTVTVVNSSGLPGTIVTDIQNAIIAQFNGVQGVAQANGVIPSTTGQRARIGSLVLAATYYGPVATCEGPSVPVQVLNILIGSVFTGTASVVVGGTTLTVNTVTSGTVSAGTVITMAGIPTGTTIVQQLTGTIGGVGTYQLSAAATATETTVAVSGAGGTSQQMGIDQVPVIGTITVNLVA
jgi:hypothetical protein